MKGVGFFVKPIIYFLLFVPSFHTLNAQNLESSNLPIVVIDTDGKEIIDEPKIMAKMGIINNGSGLRNNLTDPFNEYNGHIGIELRGSSSRWIFPKKGYGIETRTETGENLNVELLGMPQENDWVLHGPYSDKSLIRNHLTYKLGRDMGRYASRSVPVEVVLNDEYWGLYMVMEKIKRDSNRVDIATLNPDENTGDDLTGGYIIKLDKSDGANSNLGWYSPVQPPGYVNPGQAIYFQYHYPKTRDITPEQQQYIREYVTTFEEVLAGSMFSHPEEGYAKYIDVDSFIDFFIMMEVTRNVDGYRLSTFLSKDKDSKGGKLTLGPIWDFNLAFGNADYCEGWKKDGWAYKFNDICPGDAWFVPFWWARLMEDPGFRLKLKTRWTELRSGSFSIPSIMEYIDSQTTLLNEARQRNFQKWPVIGEYIWPNYFVGETYFFEIEYMKNWIVARMNWLDQNIGIITSIQNDTSLSNSIPPPYPNPFTDHINFNLPDNSTLKIFNAQGILIYQSTNHPNSFLLSSSEEPSFPDHPGTFIYHISTENGETYTGKILHQ